MRETAVTTGAAVYDTSTYDSGATFAESSAQYYVVQGQLLSMVRDGIRYDIMSDALGSVRMVTGSDGTVAARFDYDAWGNLLDSSFDDVPGGMPYRFVGGLGVKWDEGAGLHYMRHRWYDPGLGRFVSRDPMGDVNLYEYARNSPVTYSDPTGLVVILALPVVVTGSMILFAGIYKAHGTIQNWSAGSKGVPEEQILAAMQLFKKPEERALARQVLDYFGEKYPNLTQSECGVAAIRTKDELKGAFGYDKRVKFSTDQFIGSELGVPVPINYATVTIGNVEIDLYVGSDRSFGPIFTTRHSR